MSRYGRARFDWKVDYPISRQKSTSSIGTSNITLEFELNPEEIEQFKLEVKSNLNGTLPLMLSFGSQGFDVTVKKQGLGQSTPTKKSTRIADFISKRLDSNISRQFAPPSLPYGWCL